MTYPFVHAAHDLGLAKGPRRAVVWHMAEGGGTVGYLAKPNPNGVSVHYVVERSGRIVQMLALDHMHSSIRPTDIRGTDDRPFTAPGGLIVTYGHTAAHDVMGAWADVETTRGPNHASIAVECEGFAATGPVAAQLSAIAELALMLEGRFPGIRPLGHRDFADYKPCPGHNFPWALLGGHGPEVGMDSFTASAPGSVGDCPKGTKLYRDQALTVVGGQLGDARTLPYLGNARPGVRFMVHNRIAWCVRSQDVTNIRVPPPPEPAPADCSAWEAWYAQAPKP